MVCALLCGRGRSRLRDEGRWGLACGGIGSERERALGAFGLLQMEGTLNVDVDVSLKM